MLPLDIRLSLFYIKDFHTGMRIADAKAKTIEEISSLWNCGVISDEEFIRLGKELWAE